MAISLPGICLLASNPQDCSPTLNLTAAIKQYFGSKVTAMVTGSESGLPPDYVVQKISGTKDVAKNFSEMNCDLLVLPLNVGFQNKGVLTPKEANAVINHIERVVLTVPCAGTDFDFSKIVVPIDTSFETRQKVPYAVAMAKAFRAKLYVVGVSSDKGKDAQVVINNYIRQVCNNIEEKGIATVSETRIGGNPTEAVLAYAKEIGAGMITIMTEQETNFTSFFSGKYSEQMIKSSPVPVLSIHPKDLIISDARL